MEFLRNVRLSHLLMNFLFVRKFNLATRQVKNAASHCVIDRAFGIAWSCFSDNCEPSSIVDVMRKITVLTATFNSYGDRQVSPPPTKSIPPNGSTKKTCTIDYIGKGTSYTKFGRNQFTGASLQMGEI